MEENFTKETTTELKEEVKNAIEEYQCPGCVTGHDVTCFSPSPSGIGCGKHCAGTMCLGIGSFFLGMPKGFNKPGFKEDGYPKSTIDIRLWELGTYPEWDYLNVPVWAMEQDGFLFVRTFAPRINMSWVDVIEGGKLELCPQAINVAKFIDKID